MRRAPWSLTALGLLVPLVLTACNGASADEDGLMAALCAAVTAPDVQTASEVFETRVHQPLHQLADEVAAVDRTVATALLEAKYGVETVVRGDAGAPAALVRDRLQALATQTRAALAALDRPAPTC